MFTLDALRALYSRQKTFRVVENCCLHCVESIFVNLPQFAKSGLKESLNRFFWYFSLHLFGYFGLIWAFCFCESLFHCTFNGVAIETYGWKTASTGVAEVHSSPWIRFFLVSGEMGKKLFAANSTDSVFAEFLLHRMLVFNCKQRSRWNQLKNKRVNLTWTVLYLI